MSDWIKERWAPGYDEPETAVISESLAMADWAYGRPRDEQLWVTVEINDDLVIMLRRQNRLEYLTYDALVYRRVT